MGIIIILLIIFKLTDVYLFPPTAQVLYHTICDLSSDFKIFFNFLEK